MGLRIYSFERVLKRKMGMRTKYFLIIVAFGLVAITLNTKALAQSGLDAPPPQLGQPLPVNPQVPTNSANPNLIRSPLDPIGLDPLPPTIFPQPESPLDDLVRDQNIYGAIKPNGCVFFTLDLGAIKPNLSQNLFSDVTLSNGRVVPVNVPTTDLDWAVQPHLELGYRLGNGLGGFSVSWRMLATDGNGNGSLYGLDSSIKTRLNLQQGDFDYIAPLFRPSRHWDVHYRVGGRILNVYSDSTQSNALAYQHSSNNMFGGGPHAYIEGSRRVERVPGLAAFFGLDGAVIVGNINQNFNATEYLPQGQVMGSSSQFKVMSVPQLVFQTGLSFTPKRAPFTKYSIGYQLEQIWDLGQVNGSSVTLGDMGVFFRGQIDF